uniref:Zinc finger, CCHC-type n=1 Tax=Tanacetum cinerariifolium TaxID=118510 RepID=A0A6L2M529_TANCI|nr:zinc finger, CCHC-type [Tanacetum cinerariifolium]
MHVAQYSTTKEVWDSIKVLFIGVDLVEKARSQTLRSELESLKMKESETISVFASKLSSIRAKFRNLGTTLESKIIVRKLLNSVPKKFLPIVATIEQYQDLDEMSFEEAVGRLTAFEERIKSQDTLEANNQDKLLLASSNNQTHGKRRVRIKELKTRALLDVMNVVTSATLRGNDQHSSTNVIALIPPKEQAQKGRPKKNKGNAYVGLEENVREGSTGSFRGGAVRGGAVRGGSVRGGSLRGGIVRGGLVRGGRSRNVRGEVSRGGSVTGSRLIDETYSLQIVGGVDTVKSEVSQRNAPATQQTHVATANVIHLTHESQVQGVNDQELTIALIAARALTESASHLLEVRCTLETESVSYFLEPKLKEFFPRRVAAKIASIRVRMLKLWPKQYTGVSVDGVEVVGVFGGGEVSIGIVEVDLEVSGGEFGEVFCVGVSCIMDGEDDEVAGGLVMWQEQWLMVDKMCYGK